MANIGLWHIADDSRPRKLPDGEIQLEKHLEDWIEADPSLLQAGLTIIGRQITVVGGRLDLLAVDPQGRMVVIELKPGNLDRATIAQVLDYASSLENTPYEVLLEKLNAYLTTKNTTLEDRLQENGHSVDILSDHPEIVMFVVGAGYMESLERMVNYLTSRFKVPISAVSFDVFELPDGTSILSRQMTSADIEPEVDTVRRRMLGVQDMQQQADESGIGDEFRVLYDAAIQLSLYPRAYKTCIMYTPPNNRTRMLFTALTSPRNGLLPVYIDPEPFAEFYPITEKEAIAVLGDHGWLEMNLTEVRDFATRLEDLIGQFAQ